MKKAYVKWSYTDDYGRANEEKAYFDWFETMEQADEFVTEQKRRNGGYFKVWKIAEGDYNDFLLMAELQAKLDELKKKF